MKGKDLYTQEPQHLAPFRAELLRVAKRRLDPKPVARLLPEHAAWYVDTFRTAMLKSEQELEHDRLQLAWAQPYWDPSLRASRRKRREFYQLLLANNMLTFRRKARSLVGAFFVWKKDGSIRLIIDARATNLCCKPPPKTELGTISALSMVDLSADELEAIARAEGFPASCLAKNCGGPAEIEVVGSGLDIVDGFHQFDWNFMASWLAFDDPDTAAAYSVTEVWDEDAERMVCTPACAPCRWASRGPSFSVIRQQRRGLQARSQAAC